MSDMNPVLDLIAADVKQFLDESMTDPDLSKKSADFRAGYRQGFAEAAGVMIAIAIAKAEGR